jgi:GT2 family glycosyltransferase
LHIKLVELNNNVGFGKACNLGATYAKGEFIFITNQDMIFLRNFFQELLDIYKDFKKNQEIIISPAIIFEGNGIHYFGAKIHILGFSYSPNVGQKLPHKQIVVKTQRISGGSLFIKNELFLKLGGFDNIYFMYYEDTDLSLRILREGIKMYTTNVPYLIHQKHEWNFNDFRYYLLERNRFILIFKNISNYRKLIPLFIIMELILIFQSILIRKFRLKIRIYFELYSKLKFIKHLRNKSKEKMILIPYQKLDRNLDPILLGEMKDSKFFNRMLSFFNFLLKLF